MASSSKATASSSNPETQPILPQPAQPAGPTFNARLYAYDPFSPELLAYADARARSRTFKAIALGILLYVFLGLVTGFGVFGSQQRRWKRGRFEQGGPSWPGRPDPLPSDGKALSCGAFVAEPEPPEWNWGLFDSDPHVGKNATVARFEIDVSKGQGFFLSAHGSLARGKVELKYEDGQNDVIKVTVSARYNDERLLSLANVCTMQRGSGHRHKEVGIGLYTPTADLPAAASHIAFDIKVGIPRTLAELPSLSVRGAELDILGSLEDLFIPRIDLISRNAQIGVEHLSGRDVRLSATNGLIHGFYNVSESLRLVTSNGRIEADVSLSPSNAAGPIDVEAKSSNGAVYVKYLDHPLGLELHSRAYTTNGAAFVTMRPEFEGEFSISTTWGNSDVRTPEQQKDEIAGDRRFKITKSEHSIGSSSIKGSALWSQRQVKHLGTSLVATTTGAALLTFL